MLLAGILIGAIGVLDDLTISQASTVFELSRANRALGLRDLYRRAMNIGQDHIASTVNTLVLAYVGASLPLLLLFAIYPAVWADRQSRRFVTEEVVRTLVGWPRLGVCCADYDAVGVHVGGCATRTQRIGARPPYPYDFDFLLDVVSDCDRQAVTKSVASRLLAATVS
ncbi:MAG: YibE/F family protein [Anaerolineae bacterium]